MSHPFLRWLLDLDVIPTDASGLRLVWQHHWPMWVWLLLILAALLFAFWSYSRLTGGIFPRSILAAFRLLAILFVLILLSGPMIELPLFAPPPITRLAPGPWLVIAAFRFRRSACRCSSRTMASSLACILSLWP